MSRPLKGLSVETQARRGRMRRGEPPAERRGTRVGKLVVPDSALRLGILDPRLYDALYSQSYDLWTTEYGACPLGVKKSSPCSNAGAPFNVFSPDQNIFVDYDTNPDAAPGAEHTVGSVQSGDELVAARLPFLRHPEVPKRPTLLMLEVTGHVMAGIYITTPRGGELHILNSWPLKSAQPIQDVFTALEANPMKAPRSVRVVDIAAEVSKDTKTGVDLQAGELIGLCTLWVSVVSSAVLAPHPELPEPYRGKAGAMPFLQDQLNSSGAMGLPPAVVAMYTKVYQTLQAEKDALIAEYEAKGIFANCPAGASASAVATMASKVFSPLKRTSGPGGSRRRIPWTRRGRPFSSRRHRTRRVARRPGRRISRG